MIDEFRVKGQHLNVNVIPKFNPKTMSRKIFNTKWFVQKKYEHEIANHYRDYKHHRINRIRKGDFRQKNVFFEEQICNYRDVLPTKQINFPQSILPKPQKKNCKFPLLKNVYHHTLQRVVAADSLCELKLLAKRHSRIIETKPSLKTAKRTRLEASSIRSKQHRTTSKAKNENTFNIEQGDIHSISLKNIFVFVKPKETKDSKVSEKRVPVVKLSGEKINDDKDNYFLQLASECYNEGFLSHIKYLESIGERNAINNQISTRKPRHISKNKNTTTSRLQSSTSNTSSKNSAEAFSSNTGVRKFVLVVKRVLQNRYFVQNSCNHQDKIFGVIKHDCEIRVNITRSSSPENSNHCQKPFLEFQDNIKSNHCIMSEILNVSEAQSQENSSSNASSVKNQHFHNLIENLSNLEISELGSLPKIILTDFSTSNGVADNSTIPKIRISDNAIVKQQSLDVELPNISDYSSEARPP